jgi:methylmalonyl-CoA carboxyltransferase 12S subunit
MSENNEDLRRLLETVEQLSGQVARLEDRLAHLEARGDTPPEAAVVVTPERIDTETMMTIAAALAAYLGKKPRIRAVKLLRSDAWAQEGRTTIQAWYSVSPSPSK